MSGAKVNLFGYRCQAKSCIKPGWVVRKVKRFANELFPRMGDIVTDSALHQEEVVKTYNGRG